MPGFQRFPIKVKFRKRMLLTIPSTVMVLNITNYPHVGPGGLNATGARGPATLVWAFAATTDTAIQSDLY